MKKLFYAFMLIAGYSMHFAMNAAPLDYRRRFIISDGQYGFPPSQGMQYTPNTTSNWTFDFKAPRGIPLQVEPVYDPRETTIYKPERALPPERHLQEVK